MKRRNFLSGLLAAPLALKARLLQFAGQEPVDELSLLQRQFILLMNSGKPIKEIMEILQPGSFDRWAKKHPTPSATINGHRIFLN